jgi:hypothetical protein
MCRALLCGSFAAAAAVARSIHDRGATAVVGLIVELAVLALVSR